MIKFAIYLHFEMKNLLFRQKQVLLFILAGGVSAIAEVGSFKIFSTILPQILEVERDFYGIKFLFSNILSSLLGVFSNYFLSIWFVFKQGKHSKRREFLYFTSISILSNLLSLMMFQVFFQFVFKDNLDVIIFTFSPKMISKITAILVVSLLTYFIKKKLIFNG